jgi:flagellar hook-length control protein FliK
MASIPFAAFVAAPQPADSLLRGPEPSQPSLAPLGESRGDSFRDLLRNDRAQQFQSSDQRPAEPDRPAEQRQDEVNAAATAAPATSTPPQDDRPRSEDAAEVAGKAAEEPRAEASDNAGHQDQPADSAPEAPTAAADELAHAQDEKPADAVPVKVEKPAKPHGPQHDVGQKPAPVQQAVAQADEAKPKTQQTASTATDKPQGPPKAEAAKTTEKAAAETTKTAPEQVAPDAHVEPAATNTVVQEAAAGGEGEMQAQSNAPTTNGAATQDGDGDVAVSTAHSTVIGPSAPVGEAADALTDSPSEPATTAVTAKAPGDSGNQRSAPSYGNAAANGPTNAPPAAGEASGAAQPSSASSAPSPTAPMAPATAGAENTASPVPQEVAQAGATDPSATADAPESAGSTERTDSTARTHGARAEAPKDGSLSVADRVRLVHRVTAALEAAQGRGGELRMRLEPPELGSIRVELTSDSGSISARIEAESSQVQRLLLESLPQLRERLAEQQIKIEHFQVDVMNQHDRQFAHMRHDQHERSSGDARSTSQPGHDAAANERQEQHHDMSVLRQQMPWELDRLNVLV